MNPAFPFSINFNFLRNYRTPENERKLGTVAAALQVIVGSILQGFPQNTPASSCLLQAGFQGGSYAYSSEAQQFNMSTFVQSEAKGVVNGLLSWGVSHLNPGGYLIRKMASLTVTLYNSTVIRVTLTSMLNSAILQITQMVTHSIFERKRPNTKKILISTTAAAAGAGAESIISHICPIPQLNLQRIVFPFFPLLAQTSVHSIVENCLLSKPLSERLIEKCSLSLLIGSLAIITRELHSLRFYYSLSLLERLINERDNWDKLRLANKQARETFFRSADEYNKMLQEYDALFQNSPPEELYDLIQSTDAMPLDQRQAMIQYLKEVAEDRPKLNILFKKLSAQLEKKTESLDAAIKTWHEGLFRIQDQYSQDLKVKIRQQAIQLFKQGFQVLHHESMTLEKICNALRDGETLILVKKYKASIFLQEPNKMDEERALNNFLQQHIPMREGIEKDLDSGYHSIQELSLLFNIQIPKRVFEPTPSPFFTKIKPTTFSLASSSPSAPEFVDIEDWEELTEHLIMVHGVGPHNFSAITDGEYFDGDENYKILYILKKILTGDGVFGSHLDYKQQQFRGSLIDRPHLHWACAQLCQPIRNTYNIWEESKIMILEPLKAFEPMGAASAVHGIAPYDSWTIGPHHLSRNSTLLVPEEILEDARDYLISKGAFKGTLVGYPNSAGKTTARQRVFEAIQTHYPQAWHLIDPNTGEKIAPVNHVNNPNYLAPGYFKETCFERPDGKRVMYLTRSGEEEGEIVAKALRMAKKRGKFIGIHMHSITYWLEDNNNRAFRNLKESKKDPTSIRGKSCFIGFSNGTIESLVILEAYNFYDKTQEISEENRLKEVGEYILYEALYSDLLSLFYAKYPTATGKTFTRFEVELMLKGQNEKELLSIVETLFREQTQQALQNYQDALIERLDAFLNAKMRLLPIAQRKEALPDFLKSGHLLKAWKKIENKQAEFEEPIHPQELAFFNVLKKICEKTEIASLITAYKNLQMDSPFKLALFNCLPQNRTLENESVTIAIKSLHRDRDLYQIYLKYGLERILLQALFAEEYL